MLTRNVVLTERQEELIETLVKSGRYQNTSEVLCDGLPSMVEDAPPARGSRHPPASLSAIS
jgi:putative addiction module CopG family antidote